MKKSDLTVEILKDIRAEIRQTNSGLQALGDRLDARIDALGDRLDARIDGLDARIDETNRRLVASEIRTATALTDLAGNVHELTAFLRVQSDLRPRVERCEKDIAEIQGKLRPAS